MMPGEQRAAIGEFPDLEPVGFGYSPGWDFSEKEAEAATVFGPVSGER